MLALIGTGAQWQNCDPQRQGKIHTEGQIQNKASHDPVSSLMTIKDCLLSIHTHHSFTA